MEIYIAASYPRKIFAQELAHALEDLGHTITSTWLQTLDYEDPSAEALQDYNDVAQCDSLIEITGDMLSRGGRHVECGLAIAWKIPIILLGPRECAFHYLPDIRVMENKRQLLEKLY